MRWTRQCPDTPASSTRFGAPHEARKIPRSVSDRVAVADLTQPLAFADGTSDFVLCNAVIQYISPHAVTSVTIPELARVLMVCGILQLMFKTGQGVRAVYDRDFEAHRAFHLHEPAEVVGRLGELEHCVLFARKVR